VIHCIIKERGIGSTINNRTCTPTTFSKDEILQNHAYVLKKYFTIPFVVVNDYELPYLHWIPNLHKIPFKQIYIAGSQIYFTKPLAMLLTKILTAVKEMLQMHCATVHARIGIN
jgi:hypothetical protein